MYIAPGQGRTTPWGQNFDVARNSLSLCPFVASLKKGSGYSAGSSQIFPRGYSTRPSQISLDNAFIGYLTGPKIFMQKYLRNFYLFSFIW